MELDRRLIEDAVEVRELEGKRTVTGYAAVYNSKSKDLGGFREIIKEGAFASVADGKSEVRAYFNHNPNFVLGTTMSGTLRLSDTPKGLKYEVDLPNTQYARDLAELIDRGDIRGSSFAFSVRDEEWRDGGRLREIRSLELHDVSIVTNPAYQAAKVVSLRSMDAHKAAADKALIQKQRLELELYLLRHKAHTQNN